MDDKEKWIEGNLNKGIVEIKFSHWEGFSDYINQEMLDYTGYIYRGHANSSWKLEPTLDRIIKTPKSQKRNQHLAKFKHSIRGRRGSNPPHIDNDNDWWALGRHHGLATPLMDWTESPFVALFFAMHKAKHEHGGNCCIWAISQTSTRFYSEKIKANNDIKPVSGRKPIIEIVQPMSNDNSRLVNQRGLFTRGPNNVDLEDWVRTYNDGTNKWDLIKLIFPKTQVDKCIRYLNRMNINHATLFPDLYGASQFCNMALKIVDY